MQPKGQWDWHRRRKWGRGGGGGRGGGAAAAPIQKVGRGGNAPKKHPPPPKKKKKRRRGEKKKYNIWAKLVNSNVKKQIYASIFHFRRALCAQTDYLSCMSPISVARGGGGTGGIAPTNMLFTNKLKTGKGENFRLARSARSQSFEYVLKFLVFWSV